MDYLYHGSKIPNLKKLKPGTSMSHGKQYLYATSNKCLAIIFSMHLRDLLSVVAISPNTDEPITFVERKAGVFDSNLHSATSIYTVKSQDFYQGTSFSGDWITEIPQQVLSEEHIKDAYEELKKMEEQGILKMYHYPNRPKDIKLDNSDLIDHWMPIYRNNLGKINDFWGKFTDTYPELKNLLQRKLIYDKIKHPITYINYSIRCINRNINRNIKNFADKSKKLFSTKKTYLLPSGQDRIENIEEKEISPSFKESIKVDLNSLKKDTQTSQKKEYTNTNDKKMEDEDISR